MLVPDIELQGGKAVQSVRGREAVLERDDVLELAERFGRVGEVSVVDLDAARGQGENEDLIRRICRVADCRVGGGIRDEDKARRILRAGARKIVIGTAASREFLSRLPRQRVMVALDSFEGDVVTEAWTQRTGRTPVEMMQILAPYCSGFLCTFVETEGTMTGLPADRVRELKAATSLPLTVAGGVRSADEVRALDGAGVDVQVGMALYTGAVSPAEAFAACMDFRRGPLPTAVLDQQGQVLRVVRSTRETLVRSLEGGRAEYLVPAGDGWAEEPAPEQRVVRVHADCDRDSLVFHVDPTGPGCRRGTYSCIGTGGREFGLDRLYEIIVARRRDPRPGSYTSFLFEKDDRIPRKLNEEIYELLTARSRDDMVWEAADVLYFLLTYLAKHEVSLSEVVAELRGRER